MIEQQDAYKKTLDYFKDDTLATDVFLNKYALRDKEGNFLEEIPDDMHHRLASELARIEQKYPNPLSEEEIYNLLKDFRYLVPQGSPMAGIGNDNFVTSISNCFVIGGSGDSYGSIMKADEEQVQLMKRRGGVGQDISHIRPKGALVGNSALTSAGIVPLMERYSNSTREVAQYGRRGALMLSLSINHPDAEDFIDAKMIAGKVTGANVSVKITDEFMKAIENGDDFYQTFPVNFNLNELVGKNREEIEEQPYNKLVAIGDGLYVKRINARKLWNKIIHNAWKSAEPGILFWDKITSESPADSYGGDWKTISTNPCFTGDTLLLTNEGYKTFNELKWSNNSLLKEDDLPLIANELGKFVPGRVWSNGYKHIIKLVFDNNSFIECTPNHVFKLADETECEASNLIGKIIKGFDGNHAKVTCIENGGIAEVFDFNLHGDNHWGVVGGLIAHNCGEIPLCPYDSCRLLAINLYSYVVDPFTENAIFDEGLFKEHVRIAQRLMDDIVDLEIEKLDKIIAKIESDPEPQSAKYVELHVWQKIKDKAIRGRRTGLGITAEGDMLAALGLKYGTPEATDFSEEIHKTMAVESYKSSIKMAKERGAFPDWDLDTERFNPFISRIFHAIEYFHDQELWINDYCKYGRRNISNLTIAPTGTTSMMTQTTSGIEPVFLPFYKRRRKTDDPSKVSFTDELGDTWEEYNVFHHKFVEWFISSSELSFEYKGALNFLTSLPEDKLQELYKDSPYYGATSNDVDYIEKVKMQGRIQKWIDHSISVTVNMPEDVTEKTVSDVYMEAWKNGCKGVTVYREGSRSGVLVSTKEKKKDTDKFKPVQAFKRPQNVPCDIHIVKSKGEPYVVMVGILDGYPYETFAFKTSSSTKFPEKGILSKRKTGWYDLLSEDKKTIHAENLANIFEIPDEENVTRLVSGWLRSRGDIKYIVDILNKSKGDITTFSKVLARVLKKYIKDGEKSSEKCPNCGDTLVFEEGCLNCKSCGHSKCG
jgi:ribonucleotide reductase alpha subunit